MTENRDFLGEMQQLRAETDGIRNALVSNPTLSNNSIVKSGILEEIARDLKNVRSEIKEMKTVLLQENKQLRQKMDETERKNEEKLSELQWRILEELAKNKQNISQKLPAFQQNGSGSAPEIPIREAIIGEWKMVEHEDWELARVYYRFSFEKFSENLKYEMGGGKLKQTKGNCSVLLEEGNELYVEDNHLKSCWDDEYKIDRYIQDGRLHVKEGYDGCVWERVYEKI